MLAEIMDEATTTRARRGVPVGALGACALLLCVAGCKMPALHHSEPIVAVPSAPRELNKITLPSYTVEPPDILLIDAVRIVPKAPFRVNTLDVLMIQVVGALPDAPISGTYTVEPGGAINLGIPYGKIAVLGSTLEEIASRLQVHLKQYLREPLVSVSLAELSGKQQIGGQHLVGPDGSVTLGSYGSVYVTGLTLAGVKTAIEGHLQQHLDAPEVSVDVYSYNSRVYYVITQGAGLGDGVARVPWTGNETVLDAISQINGLQSQSSTRIWIARPVPGTCDEQILPVDWYAVTARGAAATNYQILPGDRVFVAQDRLVAFDTKLSKLLAPLERVFGATLLGTSTAQRIKFFNSNTGNTGGGVF